MKRVIPIIAFLMLCTCIWAQEPVKLGIIGLDTSHSTAFSKLINTSPEGWAEGFRVVAAYPHGSSTIKSSYERIPKFTEEIQTYGVEIVDSIDKLIDMVDCAPTTFRGESSNVLLWLRYC